MQRIDHRLASAPIIQPFFGLAHFVHKKLFSG
jgi:hypothetical protein